MITDNKVVSMNYVLKDDAGKVLDASEGQPLQYLQGHGNIIPGLEKALACLAVGERKQVVVPPQEGYGTYNPELKFSISLDQFNGEQPVEGMMVQLNATTGETVTATILGVAGQEVLLDANHPLAGQNLCFDVEITDVRDASAEELAHGHPHGPHGHHH